MLNESISDIHICEASPAESIIFPGPRRIDESEKDEVASLLERAKACNKLDFMVTVEGNFFRGRKETRAVDGAWYMLRRMPSVPPTLDGLPSPLPQAIKKALLSRHLLNGGLVYVIGAPGSGKTTTASATVVSRLQEHGGFACSVEDPPEMPLNGWHEKGYCRQTWVAGDNTSDWAESFRSILRSQPAGTPVILFVGEVRDSESANAMLRAAANGFLVVATGFGSDVPTGIEALVKLAGGSEQACMALAGVLRAVVLQKLMNSQLIAQSLVSPDAKSAVAAKIRAGHFPHLGSDMQFQANQQILGQDLFSSN